MSATAFPPLTPPARPRVFGAPRLHTDSDLLALAIANDGTLWSVEEPGLLRQWNLGTRHQVNQWQLDEQATVWAFNWAGRLLASGSNEVDVWEISSGEQLVGWHTDSWVTALAFQPYAAVLATGHDDGFVRVWEWGHRKLLHQIRAHKNAVSALVFNWDRTRLATAGEDRLIHIWNLTDGKRLATLEGHTDRIPALAWHTDHRRLFSAGWDTTVRAWDVEAAQPIILLNSHAAQVHSLSLSADGTRLASSDSDQAVHLWDLETYVTLDIRREGTGEITHVCFTPDDDRGNVRPPLLAFGGSDCVIHLHDTTSSTEAERDPLLARVNVAATDGRLFSASGATELRGWDLATAQPIVVLEGAPRLRTIAVSPDGNHLAAARIGELATGALAIYDASTGSRLANCDGPSSPTTALAFRGDGALLASGGVQSCDVWVWSVPSGEPALIIPDAVDQASVEALAFQPKGELLAVAGIDYLATGGSDGQVAVWHPSEKRLHLAIDGGAAAIAWHPEGRQLAVATLRRTVRIHDLSDGRVVQELSGHLETITSVAYSPDSKWIATGSDDRTVRLWDTLTGEQICAWELDNAVKALSFSPDGRWLFTGNANTSCYQLEVELMLATS